MRCASFLVLRDAARHGSIAQRHRRRARLPVPAARSTTERAPAATRAASDTAAPAGSTGAVLRRYFRDRRARRKAPERQHRESDETSPRADVPGTAGSWCDKFRRKRTLSSCSISSARRGFHKLIRLLAKLLRARAGFLHKMVSMGTCAVMMRGKIMLKRRAENSADDHDRRTAASASRSAARAMRIPRETESAESSATPATDVRASRSARVPMRHIGTFFRAPSRPAYSISA